MSLSPEARARLRARFLQGLPERLELLTNVRARLADGPSPAGAEATVLGHQFAGMGTSFGFPELTERGRELEHAPHEQRLPALDRLIASVRSVIDEADPPTPTSAPSRDRP